MPRFVTPDEADELRESVTVADNIVVVGQTAAEREIAQDVGAFLHIDPAKLTVRIAGPEVGR
jgi:hypothetical protein